MAIFLVIYKSQTKNCTLDFQKNKKTKTKTKTLWYLFMDGSNCLKATEPLRGDV